MGPGGGLALWPRWRNLYRLRLRVICKASSKLLVHMVAHGRPGPAGQTLLQQQCCKLPSCVWVLDDKQAPLIVIYKLLP